MEICLFLSNEFVVSKYFGYHIFVHEKVDEVFNKFISGFVGVLNIQLVTPCKEYIC